MRVWLENAVLFFGWQSRIQRQDFQRRWLMPSPTTQCLGHFADVSFGWKKNQHVARFLPHQFFNCRNDGLVEIAFLLLVVRFAVARAYLAAGV